MRCVTARARRCFVHIGLPKTGTSYLQSVLWRSTDALADQGVDLLMQRPQDHFHVTLDLRSLLDEAMDAPSVFTAVDRLATAAAASPSPTALLSQESLAPADAAQISRLLEAFAGFEVHVVVTARDLARQVPSAWQQKIQGRQVHPYDEFLDAVVQRAALADAFWVDQDLVGITDRWSAQVSSARVHVVTVPQPGSQPGLLLERFCRVVGVEPDTLAAGEPTANTSLGLVQAELLRRVNVALGDRLAHPRLGYNRVGKGFLAHRVLGPQGGRPPTLPPRFEQWCHDTSATTVAHLRDRGYDVVGDLAELMPDASTVPGESEVTDEEVAVAAAQALATVLVLRHEEGAELLEERARARRQSNLVRTQRRRIAELQRALEGSARRPTSTDSEGPPA